MPLPLPLALLLVVASWSSEMAITVDDLPWVRETRAGETSAQATNRLLAHLSARNVPGVGFVNCARIDDHPGVLDLWRAAGMELGNHTATHPSLSRIPVDAWTADARGCQADLTHRLGAPPRWFRYPMLHQGRTPEVRDAAYRAVAALPAAVAHVTVDNSEWRLAFAHGRALRAGDDDRLASIAEDYVAHLVDAAQTFRHLGRRKTGRDVAHVLLVHANALAADHLGRVLDALAADDWTFIPLEQALADPVFTRPDTYAGPAGVSWLHRIDPVLPDEYDWEQAADAALVAKYGE